MAAPFKAKCKRGHDLSVTRKRQRSGHAYCGECNKENSRRYPQAYTREQMTEWHLRRSYGIGIEEKRAMVEAQGDKCAICRSEWGPKGPSVDHDHETGRVRGMLCTRCNMGLGYFRDKADLLQAAARYLG